MIRFFEVFLCAIALVGCQSFGGSQRSAMGTLQVQANGEDFVRQGFTSKDGWEIDFSHLYIHLEDVTAYQAKPPFAPESDVPMQIISEVTLPAGTVDLAAGDANSSSVVVGQVVAPAGQYNALSWKMTKAEEGPLNGQVMVLMGQAQKQGRMIDFVLNVDREFAYTCGEFVGDERKGVVPEGKAAELEATFHFDHVFGVGDLPADDELNLSALGFEPLAALAEGQKLEVDWTTLETRLSPEHFQALDTALSGLGHVGEGHCRSDVVTS